MGEWYDIGLMAGEKVAEAVDRFIKEEHKDNRTDNFDPKARKKLSDGTVMYKWYMKWQPGWYKDEKNFMDVLDRYNDEAVAQIIEDDAFEDEYDYAWKLVAVGDEGGHDERGNNIGMEIFDGLYEDRGIIFPESWNDQVRAEFDMAFFEKPGESGLNGEELKKLYERVSGEVYPLEISAKDGQECSAMGFIRNDAAEKLEYETDQGSELADYIGSILSDMEKETEDGVYDFKGLKIWIGREAA